MSFDSEITVYTADHNVSIPLEQGDVFRHIPAHNPALRPVSIPLEQGNVFRREKARAVRLEAFVSIPLEQGNVFRPNTNL